MEGSGRVAAAPAAGLLLSRSPGSRPPQRAQNESSPFAHLVNHVLQGEGCARGMRVTGCRRVRRPGGGDMRHGRRSIDKLGPARRGMSAGSRTAAGWATSVSKQDEEERGGGREAGEFEECHRYPREDTFYCEAMIQWNIA
eukprot:768430-Hanusia_phi.AAC.4